MLQKSKVRNKIISYESKKIANYIGFNISDSNATHSNSIEITNTAELRNQAKGSNNY